MKFSYKARTKDGELQVGNIEADTRDAAANVLLSHGLFVLDIQELKNGRATERVSNIFNRVRLADLMVFTRQFATLLESQVSLDDSLSALYRQTTNPILKEAIVKMVGDIEAGHSLSQALEAQGSIFSDFYINMIKSAEVTGRLSEVLGFLADYIENEEALIGKVKNALTYPIFVIGLFFVVLIIIVTFVMPQVQPIFKEANIKLSFFTSAMFGMGEFVAKWWWAVGIVVAMFVLMIFDYLNTPEGRVVRDETILRIPIVGTLFRKVYVARFAQSAMVLIRGGLTIPQAIDISSRTIGNVVYQDSLTRASEQVRKGRLLSQALAEMPEFPPLVSQLVAVGESTGRLENLLGKIDSFYSREVSETVDNLVNILQPILMVVIGVVVALLFASVLMPMYNLSQSIGG